MIPKTKKREWSESRGSIGSFFFSIFDNFPKRFYLFVG